MKRRDYLKNMGLSSLGLAVFNPDEKAIENHAGMMAGLVLRKRNGQLCPEADLENMRRKDSEPY